VPVKLEREIMEWAEFEWAVHEEEHNRKEALSIVPKSQLFQLKKHLHADRSPRP
jgi:hypothetical protein